MNALRHNFSACEYQLMLHLHLFGHIMHDHFQYLPVFIVFPVSTLTLTHIPVKYVKFFCCTAVSSYICTSLLISILCDIKITLSVSLVCTCLFCEMACKAVTYMHHVKGCQSNTINLPQHFHCEYGIKKRRIH